MARLSSRRDKGLTRVGTDDTDLRTGRSKGKGNGNCNNNSRSLRDDNKRTGNSNSRSLRDDNKKNRQRQMQMQPCSYWDGAVGFWEDWAASHLSKGMLKSKSCFLLPSLSGSVFTILM
jgi:hypothetical protein